MFYRRIIPSLSSTAFATVTPRCGRSLIFLRIGLIDVLPGLGQNIDFRLDMSEGNDDFTSYIFDFAGLGTKGLRADGLILDDESILPYAGLISQKPHTAKTLLENIISDHFQVKAKVEQFFGAVAATGVRKM